MFAMDRDLLALEPNVFRDAGWVGQRTLSTTGSISASTLTVSAGDLIAAGVSVGSVLLYDAVSLEVVAPPTSTSVQVSLLRGSITDPVIPPPALGSKPVSAWTFKPQLALTHLQILRMIGIEPTDQGAIITESRIVNPAALTLAESLGTLHLIYSAASALSAPDGALAARAQMYRDRFNQERGRVSVRLDLDGDGIADVTRRLSILQLVRG